MSQVEWYIHKAEQCARLARAAVDRHERSKFKTERTLWLEIAAKIKIAERLEERSGPARAARLSATAW